MKIAISNEKPGGKVDGSWWKALARRLRDWLNGLLLEPGRSAVDGDQGHAARAAQGQDSSANPGRPGETDAPPRSGLVENAGPPEEWLAIVREVALYLLLPMAEGGSPWLWMSPPGMQESVENRLPTPGAPPPP